MRSPRAWAPAVWAGLFLMGWIVLPAGLHAQHPYPPPACEQDPAAEIRRLFVDVRQQTRALDGLSPVRRAVFVKLHGCAAGTFTVEPGLPENLKIGVFQQAKTFPVWARFSSDIRPGTTDVGSTLGIGIKLFGVPGPKLLTGEEQAATHDFVLQNHPVFFVNDAKEMCQFTYAGVVMNSVKPFLDGHKETAEILEKMKKNEPSVLTATYWSTLPYRLGPKQYVKYKVRPCAGPEELLAQPPVNSDYLRDDLKQRLLAGGGCFDFFVQLQTDPKNMPIDQATREWDEKVSPPIRVARLEIPAQNVDAPGQAAYCENLSYTPWHALEEHRPAGSISEARRVVYKASADLRRSRNGQTENEPVSMRKPPAP